MIKIAPILIGLYRKFLIIKIITYSLVPYCLSNLAEKDIVIQVESTGIGIKKNPSSKLTLS